MGSQKESIPSPHHTAEEIIKRLQNFADPQIARQGQRFFKDKVCLLGIPAPKLRQEARLVYNKIKPYWTLEETLEFCRFLFPQLPIEIRSLALLVLGRYIAYLEKIHLEMIKGWLQANHFNNWALVDLLSPTIISPLIEKHPEIINELFAWTKDPNLWVRRAALVSLVPLVRQGKFLSEAYKMVHSLSSDKEDLIHKAMG